MTLNEILAEWVGKRREIDPGKIKIESIQSSPGYEYSTLTQEDMSCVIYFKVEGSFTPESEWLGETETAQMLNDIWEISTKGEER